MPRRDEEADSSGEGTSWLVLRHVQAEGLGLLANVLRDRGIHHRYLDIPRGDPVPRDLRGVGGLIVLGGPMAVYEADRHPFLPSESDLIERALAAGRPVLGICLGAQLIASVLGARVYAGERREIGWAPITLTDDGRDDAAFGLMDPTLTVFHLHGDTYELPADAKNLARSATYEQQAFRWGDLVYGLQFHLEFTETMIQRLATESESRAYITAAGVKPESLLTDAGTHVRRLGGVVQRVFSEFFSQCGL
ncbi:MAG TPA: gamma-glutamyl-gamma-aminobutyrate hydrolase family protein [Candidatus Binatia bacterium]|nr:gamma-glutamyl-gamma-aminobutyrate hydrolase family protein [Candidatus Binatia bacterium]